MIYFKLILILFFNFILLQATTNEDAEKGTTSQWQRLNSDDFSSINNVRDKSKQSRVIEFKGAGTKQIYALYTSEEKQSHEYWVSWDMKFSEDFVIILQVQSNLGKHYLIYTPGTFNSYMQYGLGAGTTEGKWKTFKRNIQQDIAYYDNRVKIVSLKRFVLKGNGKIDNIKTILGSSKHTSTPKKKVISKEKLELKEEPKKVLNRDTNSAPIIKMEGKKIVKLRLGESYVEEGVSAYDKEDGTIDVVAMENIYSNEAGRYMVLYMATDSDGNIAIDKRYVDVGDVKSSERTVSENKTQDIEVIDVELEENDEVEDEYEALVEEEMDSSEQAAQMRRWERKLELREKELAKRRE